MNIDPEIIVLLTEFSRRKIRRTEVRHGGAVVIRKTDIPHPWETPYDCPECGQPLTYEREDTGRVTISCGWPQGCGSYLIGEGPSVSEAFWDLEYQHEKEQNQKHEELNNKQETTSFHPA